MQDEDADLGQAFKLLLVDPERSARICRAVLKRADDPTARLMLAGALRLQGDFAGAHDLAAPLAQQHPNWIGARFEAALAEAALGRVGNALPVLEQLATGNAGLPGLWRALGGVRLAAGDARGAEAAYQRHLGGAAGPPEPAIQDANLALKMGDDASAERWLRLQLSRYPDDVLAQRLLAAMYARRGRPEEAEAAWRACLALMPHSAYARFNLAGVLFHKPDFPAALLELDALLREEPDRLEYLHLKADALSRIGEVEASAAAFDALLARYPDKPAVWVSYGHVLRALGRRDDAVAAYRRAIALQPGLGDAYWGLANLKAFKFDPSELDALRAAPANINAAPQGDDWIAMQFALGKALEDEGDVEAAFGAYARGNAARRARVPHDAGEVLDTLRRSRGSLSKAFFEARADGGCQASDPIFIIGMPRAGSTLVEQILASHSQVEGTMELVELPIIARRLYAQGPYPEVLAELTPDQRRRMGEEYIERTRPFRKTNAPYFIDKLPNNFANVPLLHLILPRARIIDVRRNPLACCVSNFKQHWATGQAFAYDLKELGAFYRDYVNLMAHIDAVLPGRVHRVIYEQLVAGPEAETRRLLDACGLPFEPACLKFYENKRAIHTPSSEQVRQPIFRGGVDNWRPFEPWLAPLKEALGPALEAYPDVDPSDDRR